MKIKDVTLSVNKQAIQHVTIESIRLSAKKLAEKEIKYHDLLGYSKHIGIPASFWEGIAVIRDTYIDRESLSDGKSATVGIDTLASFLLVATCIKKGLIISDGEQPAFRMLFKTSLPESIGGRNIPRDVLDYGLFEEIIELCDMLAKL